MKFRKLLSFLLLPVLLFSACGQAADTTPKITGTLNENTNLYHYVEGTLHDVNINYNAPASSFIKNGTTEYSIVKGKVSIGQGLGLITGNIVKATGVLLPTIELSEFDTDKVTLDSHFIIMGCEDLYADFFNDMPDYDTIGIAGYQIKSYGKNVFINAYSDAGYHMAALAFLRATVGYDMFSEDCVIYEKDGSIMPEFDVLERPDFDYRWHTNTLTMTERVGMGYSYEDPLMNTGENGIHNWYDFVSIEEAEEHPDWASSDPTHWQGCWTAHGNKESFTGLVNHIFDKLKTYIKKNPKKSIVLISQHDVGTYTPQVDNCSCTACQASFAYYGSMAGAWLSLCNRVALKVEEWLNTEEMIGFFGGVKDISIVALIYHSSVNPPVEKKDGEYVLGSDGKTIPKKEMWFNSDGSMEEWISAWTDEEGNSLEEPLLREWTEENDRVYSAPLIQFMLAQSTAYYTHSFYDEMNVPFKSVGDGWVGVGGDILSWGYELCSRALLYPFNTWSSTYENVRYFRTLGGRWIFMQNQPVNKFNPAFNMLRTYLNSKVEFDVNSDFDFYVEKFFKNYFGVASDYMLTFFKELQAQCYYIEEVLGVSAVHPNSKLTEAKNWPERLINHWMDLIEKSYDAIEREYKITDYDKYESYTKHVMREELFPLFVLCSTYSGSFNASDLKALRTKFVENFYGSGNKNYWELGTMNEITDLWDLD